MRKVFRDETGDSITNYINRRRIEESKELLRQTGMTLRETALMVGYNNEQSLIRFFKKYVGISPGEYRTALKLSSIMSDDEAGAASEIQEETMRDNSAKSNIDA
jgi:AraC-like DNA-binding protein